MLEQLLRDLNSCDPEVRQKAIRTARVLSSDELFMLVQMEAASNRSRATGALLMVVALLFVTCFGGLGACFISPPFLLMSIMLGLLIGVGGWVVRRSPARSRMSLAAIFTEIDDPRFVRILLALLEISRGNKQEKRYLLRALQLQLPKLRVAQVQHLTGLERLTLYKLLETRSGDRNLMLVVLKALEQIGISDAIPWVEKFAARQRTTRIRHRRVDPELDQAVADCLLFLRQQSTQRQMAQTLLRASNISTHTPEMLLRPARPVSDTTLPQELLRPQQASEENGNNGTDTPTG